MPQDRVRLMTSAFLAEARAAGDTELVAQLQEIAAQRQVVSPTVALVETLLLEADMTSVQRVLKRQVATVGLQETSRILQQLQQDLAAEDAGVTLQLRLRDLQLVVQSALKMTQERASGQVVLEHSDAVDGAVSADAAEVSPAPGKSSQSAVSSTFCKTEILDVLSDASMVLKFSQEDVPDDIVARAMQCQFWAPGHKLKGSWRFVQLGPQSRLAAARLCAGQAAAKAEVRYKALRHIPGCLVVVCKAFYETAARVDKEVQRTLIAVHNLAIGLTAQGLGVKWVTGATTENYELWELIGLEPNEEVVVGLLWYGWPATNGVKQVRDGTSTSDKLIYLP